MIRQHRDSIEAGRAKIRVEGYCPSFGSVEANLAAAKNRSNQVKSYFITHERLREEHFRTFNSARAWNGQHDVVVVAYCMTGDRAADKRTAGAPGREGSISSGMGAARVGDDDTGGSTAGSVSPAVSLPDGPESGGPPDTPDDAPGSGEFVSGSGCRRGSSGAGNGSRAVLPDGRQDQPRGVGRNGGQPGGRVRFRQALFGRYAGYLLPRTPCGGYTG